MSTVEFISEKVSYTAACNFLESNSTGIVCQNFHIYFKQSKRNKLPLPFGRSQENVHDGLISGTVTDTAARNFFLKSSTIAS